MEVTAGLNDGPGGSRNCRIELVPDGAIASDQGMRRILHYLREGVWERDLRKAPVISRYLVGSLRALLHVGSNFERHAIASYAGALTMTTLLAVVPLVATVFSVAKGFGWAEMLDEALVRFATDLPEQFRDVVNHIRQLVASIDFRSLGALSSLIVLYTGMSLFNRCERALNFAWESRAKRSWMRRFSDFIALVIVVPGLGIAAISLSSLLQSASAVESWRETSEWLGWLYEAGIGFVPYALMACALTALYKFMPSARVEWRSAVIGGLVAGPALLLMNGLYIRFQFGVSQNNQIYAALAALPLLIIYLQLAWTIVLLGAELSHGVQHGDLLRPGKQVRNPSHELRERIALALTRRVVESFGDGGGGLDFGRFASELDVSRAIVDSVAKTLERGGVLVRATRDRLLPARPGEQITVEDVRAAMRGDVPDVLANRLSLGDELEDHISSAERAHREALRDARFS